jgi:hypothetical protein
MSDKGRNEMPNEITLSVNGTKQVVSSAPETPLLFVLRNELKVTGPKMGCGMAQCGACAVLLDGEEIRTCIKPHRWSSPCKKRFDALLGNFQRGALSFFFQNPPQCCRYQLARVAGL